MQSPIDEKPITARLFSTEMVTWLLSVVFIFGVGYSALAKDAEDNTQAITEIRQAQKEVVSDISDIKASVSGMVATQLAADKRMGRQEADISRILNILQQRHRDSRRN